MLKALAYAWGQILGHYYQFTIPSSRIVTEGGRPDGPAIFVSWHATQLLGVISYQQFGWDRSCRTFIAPGLVGEVVRGYVECGGLLPTPLPIKSGNPHSALRAMAGALRDGYDIVIAVDGPSGPAKQVRPGALWLSRLTGCPIVPVGIAAKPALALPRWDRMVLPLPGATVVHVFGQPIQLTKKAVLDEKHFQTLANALNEMSRQAEGLLQAR